jgi:hypothetical protein
VRGTIKALVMQPRLQVMMNAKAARHSDRPYNQICRNRLAKQHLEPPTTTVDQWLRPSNRLRQVPTTEQRKFRLARSRVKG